MLAGLRRCADLTWLGWRCGGRPREGWPQLTSRPFRALCGWPPSRGREETYSVMSGTTAPSSFTGVVGLAQHHEPKSGKGVGRISPGISNMWPEHRRRSPCELG